MRVAICKRRGSSRKAAVRGLTAILGVPATETEADGVMEETAEGAAEELMEGEGGGR